MAPGTSPWRSRSSASASEGRNPREPAPWPRRWRARRACPCAARWPPARVEQVRLHVLGEAPREGLRDVQRLRRARPPPAAARRPEPAPAAVARSSSPNPFSADLRPRGSGWPRRRRSLGRRSRSGAAAATSRRHPARPAAARRRAPRQHGVEGGGRAMIVAGSGGSRPDPVAASSRRRWSGRAKGCSAPRRRGAPRWRGLLEAPSREAGPSQVHRGLGRLRARVGRVREPGAAQGLALRVAVQREELLHVRGHLLGGGHLGRAAHALDGLGEDLEATRSAPPGLAVQRGEADVLQREGHGRVELGGRLRPALGDARAAPPRG